MGARQSPLDAEVKEVDFFLDDRPPSAFLHASARSVQHVSRETLGDFIVLEDQRDRNAALPSTSPPFGHCRQQMPKRLDQFSVGRRASKRDIGAVETSTHHAFCPRRYPPRESTESLQQNYPRCQQLSSASAPSAPMLCRVVALCMMGIVSTSFIFHPHWRRQSSGRQKAERHSIGLHVLPPSHPLTGTHAAEPAGPHAADP